MGGSSERGVRHPLGFAADLWRRCVINKECPEKVAISMDLDVDLTEGAVRLLRSFGRMPSVSRLAVCCLRDPGFTNKDIADIFGRSLRWAQRIRFRQEEIRLKCPVPAALECLGQSFEPTPLEIAERAAQVRAGRVMNCDKQGYSPAIRSFSWTGYQFASIPNGA